MFITEYIPNVRAFIINKTAYTKSGTRDPGILVGPETRDTYFTWNPRPMTLKEGSGTLTICETRDPKQTSLVEPGAQELLFK